MAWSPQNYIEQAAVASEGGSGMTWHINGNELEQSVLMIHTMSQGRQLRMQQRFHPISSNVSIGPLSKECTDPKLDAKDMRYDQYSYIGKFKSFADRTVSPERSSESAVKERKISPNTNGARSVGFKPISHVTQSPLEEIKFVEVVPGQYHSLRGAAETWRAVQMDHFSSCTCVFCPTTLFCISDALYVLCPHCNVASPVANEVRGRVSDMERHGVGLGITLSDLAEGQHQLLRH
jgi:hypothetical protein